MFTTRHATRDVVVIVVSVVEVGKSCCDSEAWFVDVFTALLAPGTVLVLVFVLALYS